MMRGADNMRRSLAGIYAALLLAALGMRLAFPAARGALCDAAGALLSAPRMSASCVAAMGGRLYSDGLRDSLVAAFNPDGLE